MAILGGEFRDIAFCQLAGTDSWTLLNNVDSGGYVDIMYVAHHVDNNGKVMPLSHWPYRTVNFEVMKLNSDRDNWEVVKDLDNRVLFVGLNQSVSVSVAELNLRPNSIYFADDSFDLMHKSIFKEPYFAVWRVGYYPVWRVVDRHRVARIGVFLGSSSGHMDRGSEE
ncbi:hypothetical protein Vadar_009069 [Vaccinium darrowii]|uniref:Uncharacterized protein n=1 Tax=Vaccinium darrowii TaxID=229202 RepID=A0ACB7YEQ8_9ERIC|nr:hypothetical protein Vadar_009069 [Vaccinium darrowii]